jgi:hypothetical protein
VPERVNRKTVGLQGAVTPAQKSPRARLFAPRNGHFSNITFLQPGM